MEVSLEGKQPSHSVSLAVPGGGTEPLGRCRGSTVLDPRALVLGRDPCPSLTQMQQGTLPARDHLGGVPGDAVVKNPACSAGAQVQSLVPKNPTCHRVTEPQLPSPSSRAWGPQLPRPCARVLSRFSRVWLSAPPRAGARQAPPSPGFSRQEHCSELPFPSPADLPNPGIEPLTAALQVDSSSLSHL